MLRSFLLFVPLMFLGCGERGSSTVASPGELESYVAENPTAETEDPSMDAIIEP